MAEAAAEDGAVLVEDSQRGEDFGNRALSETGFASQQNTVGIVGFDADSISRDVVAAHRPTADAEEGILDNVDPANLRIQRFSRPTSGGHGNYHARFDRDSSYGSINELLPTYDRPQAPSRTESPTAAFADEPPPPPEEQLELPEWQVAPASLTEASHGQRPRRIGRKEFRATLSQAIRQQSSTIHLRVKIQDLRAVQQRARASMDTKEENLYDQLLTIFSMQRIQVPIALQTAYASLREAREELRRRDDEYDTVDEDLTVEEFHLQEIHEKLLRVMQATGTTGASESSTGIEDLSELDSYLGEYPDVHSPAMARLLSRKGDEDIILEQIQERRIYRARLVEDERALSRVGQGLDSEALEFLQSYDKDDQDLQNELLTIRREISSLHREARNDPQRAPDEELQGFSDGSSTNSDEPLFLDHNIPVSDYYSENPTLQPASNAFISQWLLNSLRQSRFEIHRFKKMLTSEGLHLRGVNLKNLVLEYWAKDAAAQPSSEYLATENAISVLSNESGQFDVRTTQSDALLTAANRLTQQLRLRATEIGSPARQRRQVWASSFFQPRDTRPRSRSYT